VPGRHGGAGKPVYTGRPAVYIPAMPRGNPKRLTAFRLDPELMEEVRRCNDNVTEAIEEALELWLKQKRRQERVKAKQPQRAA